MEEERKLATFDSNKLADLYYTINKEKRLPVFLEIQKTVAEDPILRFDPSELFLSRDDLITLYYKKTARVHEVFGICNMDFIEFLTLIPHGVHGTIHSLMFAPTIANLANEKQVAKFLDDAYSLKIFGCYAQTELGHGSDVQSLETTATYDPATEEFVLHSPTLSSTKWWPGELGLNATHAITHAQLYIKGKHYGIQTFVVPIRDMETHMPLKGITVGDLGHKLGFHIKDNGYLRFDHVRIPRENMLMKYSKVSKAGEFSTPANEKIGYATMMFVRLKLILGSFTYLNAATAIAVRYGTFRKQFKDDDGNERAILDYQLQMNKIMPLIASAYAFNASYKRIVALYYEMMRNIQEKEDFSTMNELHSILSGCKAFFTWETLLGIEVCRQSCGGHGYADYSGIPLLFGMFCSHVTLEGDNTVMALQTARYLLKSAQKALKGGKLQGSVEYLKHMKEIVSVQRCTATSKEDFGSLEIIDKALQANSCQLLWKVLQKFTTLIEEGESMKEIWDRKAGNDLFEASRAHIQYFTFKSFYQMIKEDVQDEQIIKVLTKLCLLFGIQKLLDNPLGVAESGYLLPVHFGYLKAKKEDLLEELRREAVALTDAFAIRDECLNSALVAPDGKVYETMYEWASQKNPLNNGKPHPGFMKYMKPVMGKHSQLKPKL